MDSETLGGSIRGKGFVEVINGDYRQKAKNHFTIPLLIELVSFMVNSTNTGGGNGQTLTPFFQWTTTNVTAPSMALGTDTVTKTTIGMMGLAAPIGGFPFTNPSGKTGSTSTLSNGAQVTYSATWNPGTVSGTVGEIGLYIVFSSPSYQYFPASAYNSGLLSYGQGNANWYFVPLMGSRLSVADGDFTAFTINATAPLTINWTIQFTFV